MRRSIFERIQLEKTSGVICLEMMKKIQDAGFRIAEVPVHHYHRAFGKSQFFNFRRILKTAIDVMRLWFTLVVRRQHRRQAAVTGQAEASDSVSGVGRYVCRVDSADRRDHAKTAGIGRFTGDTVAGGAVAKPGKVGARATNSGVAGGPVSCPSPAYRSAT